MDSCKKKWVCCDCTYENWATAQRCTMCSAIRVIGSIIVGGEDISVSAPSATVSSLACASSPQHSTARASSPLPSTSFICDPNPPQAATTTNASSKWSCHACTYINWPRATKCVQCYCARKKEASISGRTRGSVHPSSCSPPPVATAVASGGSDLSSAFDNHLRISSPPNNTSNNERNRRISPTSSFSSAHHNETLSAIATAMPPPDATATSSLVSSPTCSGGKWNCNVCTFDNWPRSRHCSICGQAQQPHQARAVRDTPSPPQSGAAAASLSSQEHRSLSPFTSLEAASESSPSGSAGASNNYDYERRLRTLRRRMRETDWSWLTACMGVVEGDMNPVEAYLNGGGDPTRKLSNPEVVLLNNRPHTYEAGHTLVHLAIRFHREEMLATLLSRIESGSSASTVKCVPSYVAPDLASAIRRNLAQNYRQRKGTFPCYYATEWATYSLPPEIEDLPAGTQEQLYSECLDRASQKELEEDCQIINWSEEVRRTSRLYALWNRSAGDCLLDSVLQATWGVFDRDNALRKAMADSLHEAGHVFFPRWKEWESQQAQENDFTLHDSQLADDWTGLLNLASRQGASLEQLHVFALAHVLRRPIIIYGVKLVKSWRGENLGYAKFEGVYLPLHWEPSFCSRSPIALGYTRGHFCALVPPEPTAPGAAASSASGGADPGKSTFLPLMSVDQKMLPIHFLSPSEVGREESILKQWLDVGVTEGGLWVAQQKIAKPPLLVAQMTEEWLNHYRKLAQSSTAPFSSRAAGRRGTSSPAPKHASLANVGAPVNNSHNLRGHSPGASSSISSGVCGASALPVCSTSSQPKVHEAVHNNHNNNNHVNNGNKSNNNQGYSSDGDSDEE